jgi:hypothetical protein
VPGSLALISATFSRNTRGYTKSAGSFAASPIRCRVKTGTIADFGEEYWLFFLRAEVVLKAEGSKDRVSARRNPSPA